MYLKFKTIPILSHFRQKMATSPNEDSSHFDLRQNKDALHSKVHSAAEQLCMTLEMIVQDVGINFKNNNKP